MRCHPKINFRSRVIRYCTLPLHVSFFTQRRSLVVAIDVTVEFATQTNIQTRKNTRMISLSFYTPRLFSSLFSLSFSLFFSLSLFPPPPPLSLPQVFCGVKLAHKFGDYISSSLVFIRATHTQPFFSKRHKPFFSKRNHTHTLCSLVYS